MGRTQNDITVLKVVVGKSFKYFAGCIQELRSSVEPFTKVYLCPETNKRKTGDLLCEITPAQSKNVSFLSQSTLSF